MTKIDYKQQFKEFYSGKTGQPITLTIPPMNYIMIDGQGDPETGEEYMHAIQTLYPIAYTIKFYCKNQLGRDFSVMPLEGLWWAEDMSDFSKGNKHNWHWTAMIMQPDVVTQEIFATALHQTAAKKPLPSVDKVHFKSYDEGRVAQVMYVGPYAEEAETIQALHRYIAEQGGTLQNAKHHHEIYLGDPRRTAPERLRTIIRQPY